MAKLSVVIVDYNSGDYLIGCLDRLFENKAEADLEVWVVDNASSDDSIERAQKKYPQIKFILNTDNLGYGKANNQALRKIKNENILLLNPDVWIEKGTLSTMIKYMKNNPKVGAATCKVFQGDGKIDWATHRGFPTPIASMLYFLGIKRLYHLTGRSLMRVHEVDAISGCFFMTRKSVLEISGLFDEDYFMYAEDIDLCFRIKKLGFKIMYVPLTKVIHHKGISTGLKKHSQGVSSATIETKRRSLNAFYSTMKIFYKKHYASKKTFLLDYLIYKAIDFKWWLAKQRLTV
jgi:GT2 family glycosyltransferase